MAKMGDLTKTRVPAFSTPGALDLRSLQAALDAIREGLANLKATTDRLSAASSSVSDIATVKSQVAQLIGVTNQLQAASSAALDPELEAIPTDTTARVLLAQLARRVESLETSLAP